MKFILYILFLGLSISSCKENDIILEFEIEVLGKGLDCGDLFVVEILNNQTDHAMLQTYISILRGINVSGHKKIKMDVLRKMYEGLNFNNIQTYIQSGNVIFQAEKAKYQDLEKRIAKKIAEDFGFEVPVMVKELAEFTSVLKNNPFVNKRKEEVTGLHVTFLSQEPQQADMEKIKSGSYASDEFILSGKTVYLFCPNGYGNTKLTNNFFESKLKVVATTRNWRTINELVSMAEKISNRAT